MLADKSTIASDPLIGDRDSNPARAGPDVRHVRGHAPWLRANPAIDLRFVLASTLDAGICRLFLSSVPLETPLMPRSRLPGRIVCSDSKGAAVLSPQMSKSCLATASWGRHHGQLR